MLEQIHRLIQEQDVCVLATASENRPHTSLMAYAAAQDSHTIFLASSRSTRKYGNVSRNPSVSLLVNDLGNTPRPERSQAQALTLSGVAASMPEGQAKAEARELMLARHPHLQTFLDHPDVDLLAVEVETVLLLIGVRESHFERIAAPRPSETARV